MTRQRILLAADPAPSVKVPKEFLAIGGEAIEALWQEAYRQISAELDQTRLGYQRDAEQVREQHQQALHNINQLNQDISALKRANEILERERKALENDLESKTMQLQVNYTQLQELNEKNHGLEQDLRRLLEEKGRALESQETLQKRLEALQNQCQHDNKTMRQLEEEVAVQNRYKERLENTLRSLHEDLEKQRDRIKGEQQKTVMAEAAADELREVVKKQEQDIQQARSEAYNLREKNDAEIKLRLESEKKIAVVLGQLEVLERAYREQYGKLEQELQNSKSETMTLRARMIKAEGALEREVKRADRLENKLIGSGGNNSGAR
jgi:chromosome segregation ATPase